jgi:hypothetical protein
MLFYGGLRSVATAGNLNGLASAAAMTEHRPPVVKFQLHYCTSFGSFDTRSFKRSIVAALSSAL